MGKKQKSHDFLEHDIVVMLLLSFIIITISYIYTVYFKGWTDIDFLPNTWHLISVRIQIFAGLDFQHMLTNARHQRLLYKTLKSVEFKTSVYWVSRLTFTSYGILLYGSDEQKSEFFAIVLWLMSA